MKVLKESYDISISNHTYPSINFKLDGTDHFVIRQRIHVPDYQVIDKRVLECKKSFYCTTLSEAIDLIQVLAMIEIDTSLIHED